MSWQDAVVAIVVLSALAYLVRAWTGTKRKPSPPPGPDVPTDRLLRKKKR